MAQWSHRWHEPCQLTATLPSLPFCLQVLARAGAVGWIVEVQVIPGDMYELKTNLGHAGYAKYRFILEACRRARARSSQQQLHQQQPQLTPAAPGHRADSAVAECAPELYNLGMISDSPPRTLSASNRKAALVETSFLGATSPPRTRTYQPEPQTVQTSGGEAPAGGSGRLHGAASDLLDYSEIRHLPRTGRTAMQTN